MKNETIPNGRRKISFTYNIFSVDNSFNKKVSSCYQEIISIKKTINPVKAIIKPKNRGIKDRKTLDIERNVPRIKQAIAKIALNAASSLIFFQATNSSFSYLKLNYIFNKKSSHNISTSPE